MPYGTDAHVALRAEQSKQDCEARAGGRAAGSGGGRGGGAAAGVVSRPSGRTRRTWLPGFARAVRKAAACSSLVTKLRSAIAAGCERQMCLQRTARLRPTVCASARDGAAAAGTSP